MSPKNSNLILIIVLITIFLVICGGILFLAFRPSNLTPSTQSTSSKTKSSSIPDKFLTKDLTSKLLELQQKEIDNSQEETDSQSSSIPVLPIKTYKGEVMGKNIEMRVLPTKTKLTSIEQSKAVEDFDFYLEQKSTDPKTASSLLQSNEVIVGSKEDVAFLRPIEDFEIPKFNGRFYLAKANSTTFNLIGLAKSKQNYYLLLVPLSYQSIANQVTSQCVVINPDTSQEETDENCVKSKYETQFLRELDQNLQKEKDKLKDLF
jgi:hypothetical protein